MNTKHVILTQHYPSPCGDLILGSYEDRLCLCNWVIENIRAEWTKDYKTC